jgi:hypothetical protein
MHDGSRVARMPVVLRLGGPLGRVRPEGARVVARRRGSRGGPRAVCAGMTWRAAALTWRAAALTWRAAALTWRAAALTRRCRRRAAGIMTRSGHALETPDKAEGHHNDPNCCTPRDLCSANDRGVPPDLQTGPAHPFGVIAPRVNRVKAPIGRMS